MTIFDLCKKYYPQFWDISRIKTLVKLGQLTRREYQKITDQEWSDDD